MDSIGRNLIQRLIQLLSELLALFGGGVARNVYGFRKQHFTARERDWNLKTIPALEPVFPFHTIRMRDDRQAGELREVDGSILRNAGRAARAIGRDADVVAAPSEARQFQ